MQSLLLSDERQLLHAVSPVRARTLLGAQRVVADVLSEHRLVRNGTAPLDVEMRLAHVGTLPIISLFYGAAVDIEPRHLDDDMLFQIVLEGCISVSSGRDVHTAQAGEALLLDNLAQCRLRWSAGSRQVIIRLPRAALARAQAPASDAHLSFKPVFALDEGVGGTLHLVRYLLSQAASPRSSDLGVAVEDMVVRHLMAEHSRDDVSVRSAPGCVIRAERHMRQNLSSLLTLESVAAAARVKPRTLTENFRRFRNRSPMACLRDFRLDDARARLQSGRAPSVTEVATLLAFHHLGRFSALYEQRFGELPSATRAAADGSIRLTAA